MKKFLFGLFALGLMTSCVKEAFVVETQQNTPDFVVTATVEETPATRTQLSYDNGYKTVWSAGDAINVNNMLGSYKFVLVKGANTPNAEFANDPTYSGVSAGTEDGNTFPGSGMVAVYPFNANATTSMAGDDVVVTTEIPANQTFSAGSFGQNASPMVAYNAAGLPQFSFKNVGTVFCMPLTGEGTIVSAKVEHVDGVAIAGAVTVTAVAESEPVTTVAENGSSVVTLSCGEGVELSAEPTKFYFVLAPGTYEAEKLVVTFTNSYGDFFQTTIPATLEYKRSEINSFQPREFVAEGTEELDLWVKAQAGVYMNVDRIIPSVDNLNVEAWVKDLMNQPNTLALIEEAILYIRGGNYELAFDTLNGIPGFVREYLRFDATGAAIKQVTYGLNSALESMLGDIEAINDIPSLLEFMKDFEQDYEAYGFKTKFNESLGSIADNFDAYIDAFVEEMWQGIYDDPEQDNTLTEEEAFAIYKEEVKDELEKTIEDANKALSIWSPSFAKSERNSLVNFVNKAQELYNGYDALASKEAIDTAIKALPTIDIDVNLWLFQIQHSIKPEDIIKDANSSYNSYLEQLKEQIAGNKELVDAATAAAKAALRSSIADIQEYSLVESLQVAVNDPNSTTGLVLNYLFSQEAFMTYVKTTLHNLVAEIEADAKEDINNGNIDAKTKAINDTKVEAIKDARKAAIAKIDAQLASTNETNLTSGPWGIFKKVLNWETCVKLFTEAGLLDVYNVLCELSELVDGMITFDRKDPQFEIVEFADYQENVDWWVLTYSEEF